MPAIPLPVMRLTAFHNGAETFARNCAIALGITIPISVALDNLLLGLILAAWLASGDYREKLAFVLRNRVAVAAFALFCLLGAGVSYSSGGPDASTRWLLKYVELAFVPIFVTLFRAESTRRRAWLALAFALLLTLALSCLAWLGVTGDNFFVIGDQADPVVFKHYLTQSLLMAFGAFLFLQFARGSSSALGRGFWAAAAILAIVNVLLMLQGRTGLVILVALGIYAAYSKWRWRGALAAVAAACILVAGLMLGMTSAGDRVVQALTESHIWKPGEAAETSIGMRLEFYRNTLSIAGEHPLLGTGTGSFNKEYAERIAGTGMTASDNPHNEYLHIAVQLGAIGLLALLYLFYCAWRYAPALPTGFERHLARALIITYVIGCMFNSLLTDHVEGLFFAWACGLLFAGLAPAREPASTAA